MAGDGQDRRLCDAAAPRYFICLDQRTGAYCRRSNRCGSELRRSKAGIAVRSDQAVEYGVLHAARRGRGGAIVHERDLCVRQEIPVRHHADRAAGAVDAQYRLAAGRDPARPEQYRRLGCGNGQGGSRYQQRRHGTGADAAERPCLRRRNAAVDRSGRFRLGISRPVARREHSAGA